MRISRREVLGCIGHTAALGTLTVSMPAPGAAPQTTYCLSMIYRYAEGATFDGDLFRDQHLPLLKRIYAASVDRIELRMPTPAEAGAPPPQIIATVNIWFRDVAEFGKRTAASTKEVNASMANITKAPVMGQLDQVLSTVGQDRLAVPVDSLCLSTYFPAKEGATIDANYFAETFFPKMAELYGTNAIRRIEVTGGAAGTGGNKPMILNSAHVYILDQAAYVESAAKSGGDLATEAQQHTNIQPLNTLTRLHAAA